jgi:hypothetical protein
MAADIRKGIAHSTNLRLARLRWGQDLGRSAIEHLKTLSKDFQFSVASGDLLLLGASWYVTHTGLIRLAARRRCRGIQVQPISEFSDATNARYAFKATVHKSKTCPGFVGFGDANPSNVSFLVHGAEMRIAETRAVNRALRKAYGIGICSVEEIGSPTEPPQSSKESKKLPPQPTNGKPGREHSSRSSLPIDSPAPTRSQLGQGLRDGFLRSKDPSRSHSRPNRKLREALGRLGRERPQCPTLPAQQLSEPKGRCRMRRQIQGLHDADRSAVYGIRDGLLLVRVERAHHQWDSRKPFYSMRFSILEPKALTGHSLSGRLYCTPRGLWKLNWFLRDFGYDAELLSQDQIDEKSLVGLRGVMKISHAVAKGAPFLNLDAFAPASRWEELSDASPVSLAAPGESR